MITLKELLDEGLDSVNLFSESPMRIPNWDPSQLSNLGNNFTFTVGLKEKGKEIGKFEKYDVYSYNHGKDIIDCIIDGDYVISYFQYLVNDKNIVEINRVWQDPTHIGLSRNYILNHYLKNYSGILTDNTHTEYGEKSIKKLVDQSIKTGYKIFILMDNKDSIDITDTNDLDKYYTNNTIGLKYRILITK